MYRQKADVINRQQRKGKYACE